MVKIDGTKVRSLRESKGLTQLYIATVVGVTTDTISRWENRRYPSIKEENANKLAQALEVSLAEILETEEEPGHQDETPVISVPDSRPARPSRTLLWLLLLMLVLLLPFIWYNVKQQESVTISASRLLPPHVTAGQPFPVLIQVTTQHQNPVSLILKETLPKGCEPIVSAPTFTGFDKKTGSLKLITRTTGQVTTFVYLAKQAVNDPGAADAGPLLFNGSVTLRDQKSSETVIAGATVLPLADFHWVDANRDNRIDDDEILAVYDTFTALDNINFDWQEIDDIWSGDGYYWDDSRQEYIIRE
ncbi:MAG: helix-turn-helix transcriptional regulator [Desulfobulbales bacterium]|nr:helix-turn-helix transcriptional regulator [Desulfobulbales bacterium]